MAKPLPKPAKKQSTFDMALSPFTWAVREAMLPDTLLRLARSRGKKTQK